ncbi:mannose-6-phosphate isomerase 1-like isoform X1 [Iris pallida]|uniref:Mannose-6-phosphate isomerase 1-like isoform X1 n=1 Tax=Iris pallida TaxID=29817 RepID=A0AAX6FXK5_IRIPA|nr:mannose-6-phosphate isomerase 1-like isoform X1 [Iris pallida]
MGFHLKLEGLRCRLLDLLRVWHRWRLRPELVRRAGARRGRTACSDLD